MKQDKPKRKTVFHLRKHFSVYFRLYLTLRHQLEDMPQELMYQKMMRHQLLASYLIGKNPNWHKAYWLTHEEAERRNKSYSKK